MRITSFVIQKTGLDAAMLFGGFRERSPMVVVAQDAEGTVTIPIWNVPNVAKPTDQEIEAAAAAPEPGPTVLQLQSYAAKKQVEVAGGGYSFNAAAADSAPIIVLADTTTQGRLDLSDLLQLAQAGPGFTTLWVQSTGSITLTGDQIKALALAVGRFLDASYSELGVVLAAIAAGTVTTFADIDGASWPTNAS